MKYIEAIGQWVLDYPLTTAALAWALVALIAVMILRACNQPVGVMGPVTGDPWEGILQIMLVVSVADPRYNLRFFLKGLMPNVPEKVRFIHWSLGQVRTLDGVRYRCINDVSEGRDVLRFVLHDDPRERARGVAEVTRRRGDGEVDAS